MLLSRGATPRQLARRFNAGSVANNDKSGRDGRNFSNRVYCMVVTVCCSVSRPAGSKPALPATWFMGRRNAIIPPATGDKPLSPPMYPHLVTSQTPGICYSLLVVGRVMAVDRVQTFDCGSRQNDFGVPVLIEAGVVSGLFSFYRNHPRRHRHPPPYF